MKAFQINVVDFYNQHVHGDLFAEDVDNFPILRTDAIKYLVTFRNQLQPEQLVESLGILLRLFSSKHTILYLYSSYALERIMLVKCKGTNKVIFGSMLLTHYCSFHYVYSSLKYTFHKNSF